VVLTEGFEAEIEPVMGKGLAADTPTRLPEEIKPSSVELVGAVAPLVPTEGLLAVMLPEIRRAPDPSTCRPTISPEGFSAPAAVPTPGKADPKLEAVPPDPPPDTIDTGKGLANVTGTISVPSADHHM
jgi:hypothetical protein